MFGFGKSAKEKEEERQLKRDQKKADIAAQNARTDARKKNGGSGFSVTFYEVQMPDGTKKKVRRSAGGSSGAKRTTRRKGRR